MPCKHSAALQADEAQPAAKLKVKLAAKLSSALHAAQASHIGEAACQSRAPLHSLYLLHILSEPFVHSCNAFLLAPSCPQYSLWAGQRSWLAHLLWSRQDVVGMAGASRVQQERLPSLTALPSPTRLPHPAELLQSKYGISAHAAARLVPYDRDYAPSSLLLRDLFCALLRGAEGRLAGPGEGGGRPVPPRAGKLAQPAEEVGAGGLFPSFFASFCSLPRLCLTPLSSVASYC